MYQIGDRIIYSGEGVCAVEAVGRLNISGVDRNREYYTLVPLYREGKIYAPVESPVFSRPILSRQEAEELIRDIPETEGVRCADRSIRGQTEHYQNLLHSHSCRDMVRLIKGAYLRGQERRAQGSKPGQMDERYMKRAEELLYGELAAAIGTTRERVRELIAEAAGVQPEAE